MWCRGLTEVTFGDTVPTGLNEEVFDCCPLSNIHVPAGKEADYRAVLGSFADKVTAISTGFASILSLGMPWLIFAIAVVAIGGIVTIILIKKKNRSTLVDGTDKTYEEYFIKKREPFGRF